MGRARVGARDADNMGRSFRNTISCFAGSAFEKWHRKLASRNSNERFIARVRNAI